MQKYNSLMRNIAGTQITCLRTSAFKQCTSTIDQYKKYSLVEYVKYNRLMKTKFLLSSPCGKNIENTSVAFSLILSIHLFYIYPLRCICFKS